jgi:hypothetical protein
MHRWYRASSGQSCGVRVRLWLPAVAQRLQREPEGGSPEAVDPSTDRAWSGDMLAPIQRDLKIRGYVVGQFPNPPLWIALAALLAAGLANDGSTIDGLARAIFYVALAVWAYEEAAHGVNGFRKALGAVALGLVVVAVARAVG